LLELKGAFVNSSITTHNEDCLDILKDLPDSSIDLILQDPPYNTTGCHFEYDIFPRISELWVQWKRVLKPAGSIIFTATNPFSSKLICSNLQDFKYDLIWDKKNVSNPQLVKHVPLRHHEYILIFQPGNTKATYNLWMTTECHKIRKKDTGMSALPHLQKSKDYIQTVTGYPKSILSFRVDRPTLYPTQKPAALFEWLIKTYSNPGDIVLDGYAGSGTTGDAARNTGRHAILCETNSGAYNVLRTRLFGD
jgi:site-specific DNA-methyltransferase (adenine-specific)